MAQGQLNEHKGIFIGIGCTIVLLLALFVFAATPTNIPVISNFVATADGNKNYTENNWTLTYTVTEADGDPVYNTTWFNTSTKRAALIMDFNNNESATTEDLSGYGNDGTINGAIWTDEGYSGGAYGFDGKASLDYIVLSGTFDQSIWTLCSWVKLNEHPSYTDSGNMLFHDGKSLYIAFDENGTLQANIGAWRDATSPCSVGEWCHVAISMNATASAFYIDGVSAGTSVTGVMDWDTDVSIGRRSDSGNYNMNGTIDSFMIYNYSLSANQIKNIYENNSHILNSDETNLGDIWTGHVVSSDSLNYSTESSYSFTIIDSCPVPSANTNWETWGLHNCNISNQNTNLGGGNFSMVRPGTQAFKIENSNFTVDSISLCRGCTVAIDKDSTFAYKLG